MTELSTRFNFKEIDEKWCQHWVDKQTFHAEPNPDKKPFSIVIPPPNVTGILHMGHALNNTLQDISMRYWRMNGREAMWMPGTDHAGIATQNVVEKQLAKEGTRRQEVGREAFLERLWSWKKEYGDTIIHQLKKLGSSCDWPRTRFTMDDGYSAAVKKVFVALYDKGLIYRGEYIINWCPRCLTALSDEEAEHHDTQGHLYYIQYPFKDHPQESLTVATTRPETMLGDTAVAVNPKDERYSQYIGKTIVLPLINREIPVIADDFVNPQFGTGAVKVTPAHDPNDFMMGQRHNLPFINIMRPNAVLNENAGDFSDMDRFEAREAIIETLREQKLLSDIKAHPHAVGHCYRCHTVVEPYLSRQWFVKMKPLAEPAIKVVREGKINFYPQRWTKVYMNWMENIRDWCISRQIWWGHRIPVWYCADCPPEKNVIVAQETPSACPVCQSTRLTQDEDVLDTWFSSWLWPFATLEWPHDNEALKYFYPTNCLFTAPEIIFFWVARMIMAGLEFMGDIPFEDVYLHGTVRDAKGRKMSKSLGNAIDPLEIIEEYGADALRFSLIVNSGQDLFISKEKFEIGRNFANKIWNASRLVLMNSPQADRTATLEDLAAQKDSDLPSRWIIARFYATLEKINVAIEKYKYSEAENLIYEFFWTNFCDWYLEIIKKQWHDQTIQTIAYKILENALKIIHPFMPFVTEEIWRHMQTDQTLISVSAWPTRGDNLEDERISQDMQILIDVVTAIRNARSEWNIPNQQDIQCTLVCTSNDSQRLLKDNMSIIEFLGRVKDGAITDKKEDVKNAAISVIQDITCVIPLGDVIDIAKEKTRISTQIQKTQKTADNLTKRLQNETFLNKAPADVIQKEKERLSQWQHEMTTLKAVLSNLE
ncbi:MAG: valine--tRNA ligase [Candidatus Omnitrophica bacterium]|nr:valine--tRNA ligase [Candidatus Omnitrophota bacterium]